GWAGRQAGSGEGQRDGAGCGTRRTLSGSGAPLSRPASRATLPRRGGRGMQVGRAIALICRQSNVFSLHMRNDPPPLPMARLVLSFGDIHLKGAPTC
ncbi:hypothetical protein FV241_24605, partial [Methylobacterium sp. WL2]